MVKRVIEYELTIIDKEPRKPLVFGKFFAPITAFMSHFLKNNAVSKSALSYETRKKKIPFDEKIKAREEGYSVAYNDTNKSFGEEAHFGSQAMAEDYMNGIMQSNANLSDKLHIIPNYELNKS